MYVTRPLSLYKKSPEALAEPPPEGPNSGYLVLQDEDPTDTVCCGLVKDRWVKNLPFPQNKRLKIERKIRAGTQDYPLFLIPVINQPLSSNRYYAIKAEGKHKGEAYACSTEEDREVCCYCCSFVRDQKPRPLDPNDSYQQFEFSCTTKCGNNEFLVKSVASDGHPPTFMRKTGWRIKKSVPKHFLLGTAEGLNSDLRARLPGFDNFLLSKECSEVQVVGKWYSPFMFIKEEKPEEQTKRSMYYEITLEQKWERIYYNENNSNEGNIVSFDAVVPTQRVAVNGVEAEEIKSEGVRRMLWFRTKDNNGKETKIGLSSLLVDRMIWEQERVGWSHGKEKQVKVARVEKYGGTAGSWTKFACFLLVERFVFKRMDGSLALSYDFSHAHQVKIKWEGTS